MHLAPENPYTQPVRGESISRNNESLLLKLMSEFDKRKWRGGQMRIEINARED